MEEIKNTEVMADNENEPTEENKKKERKSVKAFFKGLKGKGNTIAIILVAVLVIGMLFQNGQMVKRLDKVLGSADVSVHEIYDDTKVIKAYKTGDANGLSAEDAFVLDKLKEVIDQVITPGMTDYEKEKAIYDWQVDWVNYSDQNLSPITGNSSQTHTPYGVLKSHQAICVGNSTTFKLFMDALDIPCVIIHSTDNGEHAWDVVQLDDEWYHVDVTFDGGNGGNPGYNYFNVPDSIKDDGSWPWNHSEIPAANGTKYCYLLTNAKTVDDFYQIPEGIKESMDAGDSFATFILKDNTGFTRDIADYISNNMYMDNGAIYFDNVYSLDGKAVYKYSINRWSESEDPNNADVYEKLSEIISELNDGMQADNSDVWFEGAAMG